MVLWIKVPFTKVFNRHSVLVELRRLYRLGKVSSLDKFPNAKIRVLRAE